MLPPCPAGHARCDYNPRMSAIGRAPRARFALCLLLAAPLAAQAPPVLRARLAPVPIDVAMQETIAGLGRGDRDALRHDALGGGQLSRAWSRRRPPCGSTRARGMGMRGTLVGEFPSGGGTSGSFKGAVTSRRPGRGVRQGPALRADPERESAGRQPVGMAHPLRRDTLMMATRTTPGPSHSWPPRPPRRRPGRRRGGGHRRRAGAGAARRRSSRRRRPPPAATSTRRAAPAVTCPTWPAATTRRRWPARPSWGLARADDARAGRVHPRLDAAGRPAARRRRSRRRHRLHPGQQRRRCRPTALTADAAVRWARWPPGSPPPRKPRAHPPRPRQPATRRRAPPGRGCLRAPPARRRAATTWSARCRATRRSPTRCCARRRPATG